MSTLALILKPTRHGWGVFLTNGRLLARFWGPGSQWRARRYLAQAVESLGTA